MSEAPTLWLVGWSDSEDEDFRAAAEEAGVEAVVARVAPLGPTVGTRRHRLRSWPAYLRQAVRAARWRGPVVAWDPVAGALGARLRRRAGLVVLNPLLDPASSSRRQRVVLAGASRAERTLFFSRRAAADGVALGIPRDRVGFVPLGVRARREAPAPPGRTCSPSAATTATGTRSRSPRRPWTSRCASSGRLGCPSRCDCSSRCRVRSCSG